MPRAIKIADCKLQTQSSLDVSFLPVAYCIIVKAIDSPAVDNYMVYICRTVANAITDQDCQQ